MVTPLTTTKRDWSALFMGCASLSFNNISSFIWHGLNLKLPKLYRWFWTLSSLGNMNQMKSNIFCHRQPWKISNWINSLVLLVYTCMETNLTSRTMLIFMQPPAHSHLRSEGSETLPWKSSSIMVPNCKISLFGPNRWLNTLSFQNRFHRNIAP